MTTTEIRPAPAPAVDLDAVLTGVMNALNQIGAIVKALLDTRLLCAACVREQISAAGAGVGPQHLPPVNIATIIERSEGVCGGHIGNSAQPTLFLPAGYGR